MYPVLAQTYPATLRASGTGFVIGIGRGGSALGPVVAGALFAGGSSLLTVSLVMGLGGLVAAAMILMLPRSCGLDLRRHSIAIPSPAPRWPSILAQAMLIRPCHSDWATTLRPWVRTRTAAGRGRPPSPRNTH